MYCIHVLTLAPRTLSALHGSGEVPDAQHRQIPPQCCSRCRKTCLGTAQDRSAATVIMRLPLQRSPAVVRPLPRSLAARHFAMGTGESGTITGRFPEAPGMSACFTAMRSTALPSSEQPSGVMPELARKICSVPPGEFALPQITPERVPTTGLSACSV